MSRQHYDFWHNRRLLFGRLTILFAAVLISFSSCSDDEIVSATDSKPMPYTSYSTTTRPGDDFYGYCLGPWLDSAAYDSGTIPDAIKLNDKRMQNALDNNAYVRYTNNLEQNLLTEEEMQATGEYITNQWFDRMRTTTTKEAALVYLNDIFNRTFQSPMLQTHSELAYDGRIIPKVEATTTVAEIEEWFATEYANDALQLVSALQGGTEIIMSNGFRAPTMETRLAALASLRSPSKHEPRQLPAKLSINHDRSKGKTLTQQATRSSLGSNSLLNLMLQGHEYTTSYRSHEEYISKMKTISEVDNYLSNLGTDSLLAISLSYFAEDLNMLSAPVEELTDEQFELWQAKNSMEEWHNNMIALRDYYTQNTTEEVRRNITDMTERLRNTFKKRIANNSWLSSTAKAYAQQKLDSMKFHILNVEPLPSICNYEPDTKCLIEQLYDRTATVYEWIPTHLWGKRLRDVLIDYQVVTYPKDLMETNAYYMQEANAISILPAFGLAPLYDPSYTDAMLYGITGIVVAHEMTHGFDSEGATSSMTGSAEDWWTMEDKIRYADMQQALVNCYNSIYIGYGRYQNGQKTLDENIADCGGLSIAFDAYTDLLYEQGYSGETLKEQQRKMLRCFAQLFAIKYSEPYLLEKLNTDVHSNYRARVNGTLMNLDAFYELYNVQSGDKMYLAPNKRSKIW